MKLLSDINGSIESGFPHKHFTIKHYLLDHPLFTLEALFDLAKMLPNSQIEWNAGDASINQDPLKTPTNGLSPQETIQQIEQTKSWLVLKNIQAVPEYKKILHECLLQVEDLTNSYVTGVSQRAGFVFVSSPGSITPFHIDPEHNFLLQLRGSKTMHIFDPFDRDVIAEEHIENTYYGEQKHRNLIYKDAFKKHENSVVLQPGDAIHVPIHAPHWVKNGPEVSISFSITFRSDQSQKNVRIHTLNGRLRSLGVKPKGLGESALIDSSKDLLVRTAIRAKQVLKKTA
jgi:hypothetical protein